MRTVQLLSLFAAFVRACKIFRTRFDKDGNAWVLCPEDQVMELDDMCSSEQIPRVEGYDADNTVAVYAVHRDYMIMVERPAHVDGDIDWYKVPTTQSELDNDPPSDGSVSNLNEHTRQFFMVTDFKITTENLHDTKSRLLTPMTRPIKVAIDVPGRSGIPNIYVISCYLNAAIQMLFMIPDFRHKLAQAVYNFQLAENTLSYGLNLIFYALEAGRQPTEMMMYKVLRRLATGRPELCRRDRFQQYDSAEAFRTIVKDIEAEIQRHLPRGAPWYFRDLLYTWHSRSEYTADGAKIGEESMDDVGLVLYKLDQLQLLSGTELSIEKLITATFANSIHRDNHEHSHTLYDLPTYVFVKFPRFTENGRITNAISMPLRLDLTNRVDDLYKQDKVYEYELISVGLHSGGNNSNSGHYTAMVLDHTRRWTIMDDTGVRPAGMDAPAGPQYPSTDATCALYRRILRIPDQFVPTALPVRPNIDLLAIMANKASPPALGGGSKLSDNGSKSSGGGSGYSGGGGSGGGGGSNKRKSQEPAPTPASEPPRRLPASAMTISVSNFLLGSAAAIAALLV